MVKTLYSIFGSSFRAIVGNFSEVLRTTNLVEDLNWTLRLYSITLAFPLTATIMNIILVGIVGIETRFGFWTNMEMIWIDYYFSGELLGAEAWRWHLGLLFCSYFFVKTAD